MAREIFIWDEETKQFLTKEQFSQRRKEVARKSLFVIPTERVVGGRWVYDRDLKMVVTRAEFHARKEQKQRTTQVIKDIDAYKSMHTGEMITSRSAHREHLRRHNLVEVGNEYNGFGEKPKMRPVAEDIKEACDKFGFHGA